jgi:hypothetical protein
MRETDNTAYVKVVSNILPRESLVKALSVNVDVDTDVFPDSGSIEDILQTVAQEAGVDAAMTLASMFGLEVPESTSPPMLELNPEAETSWRCDEVSPAVKTILQGSNPANVQAHLASLYRQGRISPALHEICARKRRPRCSRLRIQMTATSSMEAKPNYKFCPECHASPDIAAKSFVCPKWPHVLATQYGLDPQKYVGMPAPDYHAYNCIVKIEHHQRAIEFERAYQHRTPQKSKSPMGTRRAA